MAPTVTDEPDVIDAGAEVVQTTLPSVIEALVRGEIDIQIATAKQYPRSLDVFHRRAIAMATLDDETAESCIYRRPVGRKNGQTEFAEGMSVRMAEIVGASYGNLRVYASLVEQTDEYVRARGAAIDLETNYASSSEVVESTLTKDNKPFSPRMRVVVAKAALAKARRDATFQVVPKALAKPVEGAARRVLMGSAQSLEKRRATVLEWIRKIGIDAHRVYHALGIEGAADLTPEKLEMLTGIRTALKDNETSLDEAFPEVAAPQPGQRKSQAPTPVSSAPATIPSVPNGGDSGHVEPQDRRGAEVRSREMPSAADGTVGVPAPPTKTPIGTIAKLTDAGNGAWLVRLSTGFQAALKGETLQRAAEMALRSGLVIELKVKPTSDPKFVPTVLEIVPQS